VEVTCRDLERLFDSVCDRARVSVQQSNHAILRQSRQRLSRNASDASALHVIAASSLVRDDPARCLEVLLRDPHAFALDPVGQRLAGYARLIKKEFAEARQCFDEAVRLDPNQPDCWNWLGQIAEHQEDDGQAAGYYERGILFDDGQHDSALALSRLHARNRQLKDAIHTLRVCLLRDRRSPKLNLALAKLLDRRAMVLGRRQKNLAQQRLRQESLECYRTVNAAAPTSQTYVLQGRLEQSLFEHDRAKESFRRAVDLDPTCAEAISHLAGAHVDFGQIDEAGELFQASIAIEPDRAETHFRYTRNKRFRPGADARRYLEQLHQQLGLAGEAEQKQIYLNFALAKVYDDLQEYDRAWTHYDRANRLKAGHWQTQSTRVSAKTSAGSSQGSSLGSLVRHSQACFTPEFFDRYRGIGNPSITPVFIVGMPRSGTTLTEQILSSHPEIAGAGELSYINQIRQEISRDPVGESAGQRLDWSSYPSRLASVDGADLCGYADDYISRIDRFRSGRRHVTDKMPTNFMHLGLIAMLFPRATIVHCRRHPMDVLVSCYCQNLNVPFCDLQQLVDYHRSYRKLMRHWQAVLPIKIHAVDYESLVCDPETNSRALISHCGLDWDEACLAFNANHRAVHTPSKWQVRQPMYRSSVEKWRRFEKHLAPIAEQIDQEMRSEST
jgi:tetratricopeptide (TPR) repeat protein